MTFCCGRPDMDVRGFIDLCKHCCLLDTCFTACDANLIFSAAVPTGEGRMDLRSFESALRRVAAMRGLEESLVHWMVAWPDKLDVERRVVRTPSGSPIRSRAHDLRAKCEGPRPPTQAARMQDSEVLSHTKSEARKSRRSGSLPSVGALRFQAFAGSVIHRKPPDAWAAPSTSGVSPAETVTQRNPRRTRSIAGLRRIEPAAPGIDVTAVASEPAHGTKWFQFPGRGKSYTSSAVDEPQRGGRDSGTSSSSRLGLSHLHNLLHGQDKPMLGVM